jgi:hypothetical protein
MSAGAIILIVLVLGIIGGVVWYFFFRDEATAAAVTSGVDADTAAAVTPGVDADTTDPKVVIVYGLEEDNTNDGLGEDNTNDGLPGGEINLTPTPGGIALTSYKESHLAGKHGMVQFWIDPDECIGKAVGDSFTITDDVNTPKTYTVKAMKEADRDLCRISPNPSVERRVDDVFLTDNPVLTWNE